MEKTGVTGSVVNELEVRERNYEHRLRAVKNLKKMKQIECTWIRVSVQLMSDGCIIARYTPVNKKRIKSRIQ
ncbi:hypothetical protein AOB46_18685 [Chryseobacterium indologenes]|uniref:Uncharacterized protein n=1 Tax=Chryseobacterium indologenes TaxID=253 RepID=A0A0N0IUN7_CHRID|nr:hypothetical protein AOB46_18685 [Chryseobacterium indologenes]